MSYPQSRIDLVPRSLASVADVSWLVTFRTLPLLTAPFMLTILITFGMLMLAVETHFLVLLALFPLLKLLCAPLIVIPVGQYVFVKSASFRETLKIFRGGFSRYLGHSLRHSFIGIITLGIASPNGIFRTEVAFLERHPEPIERGRILIRSHWGRAYGVMFISLFTFSIVLYSLFGLQHMLMSGVLETDSISVFYWFKTTNAWRDLFAAIVISLVYVVTQVYRLMFYMDSRIRAEGWHLQVEVQQLAEERGGPA